MNEKTKAGIKNKGMFSSLILPGFARHGAVKSRGLKKR